MAALDESTDSQRAILNDVVVDEEDGKASSSPIDGLKKTKTKGLSRRACAGIALTAVLLLALLVTLGYLSFEIHSLRSDDPDEESVCLTKECTVASASVLEMIDVGADPCTDFFQYACGGFNDKFYLPAGQNQVSQFSLAAQENDMLILQSLDGTFAGKGSEALQKARLYYDQCLNTTAMDQLGVAPILDLLAIPDFLVTAAQNRTKFTKRELVFGALRELQMRNVRILWDFYIARDRYNASEIMPHIRQGLLGLPDATYFDEGGKSAEKHAHILQAYKSLLWEGLNLLESRTTVRQFSGGSADEIESVVSFESKIAACHAPKESLNKPILSHNPMENEEAEAIFPVGWAAFIRGMEGPANYTGRINFETPSALECMARVLDETPIEDIALYMKVTILLHRAEVLDSDLRNWMYKFNLQTQGVSGEGPRWRQCMDLVSSHQRYGFALSKPYIQRAFGADSREEVEGIFEAVEKAFLEMVPSVPWMEEETKEIAIRKAKKMKKHLGYPDWVMDEAKVSKHYESVPTPTSFYEATMSLLTAHHNREFKKLGGDMGDLDEDDLWILSPTEINAYYSAFSNTIAFPAGILSAPFFTEKAPMPLNYGSLGTFVAHEFTHAFDNNGRQFDENGDLNDWWTDKDDAHFEERAQCFVDQYAKYELYGHHTNGNLTLAENLADNAGLQLAFRAFTKELETNKINRLPSTPWSPQQLFFLGFAQAWCSNTQEEKALAILRSDTHSLPRFRVNGVVSNSADFADAFKCKARSPMNPEEKCNLWN